MRVLFLKEYIKNIRTIGAVAPSSKYLARKMVKAIDFDTAKFNIEYGPGTGVFTTELLKKMNHTTKLLAIETNPKFYQALAEKYAEYDNIEIINASAENTHILHVEKSLPTPDYIVSGLPFTALPPEVSKNILKSTATMLGTKGVFITFQYTLLKKNLFDSYFSDITIEREVRNVPPAYVLRCSNLMTNDLNKNSSVKN